MSTTPFAWPNGTTAAVSLTYDDALPCHYEHVAPVLEAAGLRGTFYTPIYGTLMTDPTPWRELAGRGHELGNHTIFHPCRSDCLGNADWLGEWRDLIHYTPTRWKQEVQVANFVLSLLDGKPAGQRTFGNTCHDNYLGPRDNRVCLEPMIAELFVAARGQHTGLAVDPQKANLNNLGCESGDRTPFEELRGKIETKALATSGWLIFCMHGVGPNTHSIRTEIDDHQKLVDYLSGNRARIWTAPVVEVAGYLRAHAGQ
jgi:peptidoglycan/xylan/chitin deacetylase (PgdA/CDA1 family)